MFICTSHTVFCKLIVECLWILPFTQVKYNPPMEKDRQNLGNTEKK